MTDQVIVTALTCKTFQPTLLPYLLTCDDSLRKTLWRAADPLPLPPMIFDDMGQFAGKNSGSKSLSHSPSSYARPSGGPSRHPSVARRDCNPHFGRTAAVSPMTTCQEMREENAQLLEKRCCVPEARIKNKMKMVSFRSLPHL